MMTRPETSLDWLTFAYLCVVGILTQVDLEGVVAIVVVTALFVAAVLAAAYSVQVANKADNGVGIDG